MPDVRDTNVLLRAMEGIGVMVRRDDRHKVTVNASNITDLVVEDENIKKIRASYYLIGALLGKYKHENLQKLVESENISMEIFPSIWPETFSYLVSEHIAMNVPIICFDMGAQSEKVRTYTKGIIVKDIDEMVNVIIKKFNEREKKCFIKKL